ncbi:hypothetical protein AK812_SmicGene8800 [Symbiodinium microadriaticum]|uniref:Uncharacterized protein n=1 Tax=Symbiodinium microadriaticum TaxID=2951 RepID=A0A1Q9EK83_SYMMI|nr:hypothetical protein AK812_SmicGene8800 [Symbiodinium microadriaticum]
MDRANAWLARVNAWLLVGISSLVVGLLLWRRGSFPSSTTREVLERPSGNGADKKLPAQTEAGIHACYSGQIHRYHHFPDHSNRMNGQVRSQFCCFQYDYCPRPCPLGVLVRDTDKVTCAGAEVDASAYALGLCPVRAPVKKRLALSAITLEVIPLGRSVLSELTLLARRWTANWVRLLLLLADFAALRTSSRRDAGRSFRTYIPSPLDFD